MTKHSEYEISIMVRLKLNRWKYKFYLDSVKIALKSFREARENKIIIFQKVGLGKKWAEKRKMISNRMKTGAENRQNIFSDIFSLKIVLRSYQFFTFRQNDRKWIPEPFWVPCNKKWVFLVCLGIKSAFNQFSTNNNLKLYRG